MKFIIKLRLNRYLASFKSTFNLDQIGHVQSTSTKKMQVYCNMIPGGSEGIVQFTDSFKMYSFFYCFSFVEAHPIQTTT